MGLTLVAAAALVVPAARAPAAAGTPVYFVQGEQLVAVDRPGSSLEAAVRQLLAGPTAAERKRQLRTYVRDGTPLRSVSMSAGVATVDLAARFVAGTDADALRARLAQVVYTATAVGGVTSVRLLVKGGVPLGLFPGIDASVRLTPRSLATPDVTAPRPVPEPRAPVTASARRWQRRLADLGYLPRSEVDGRLGPATHAAVVGFQKWARIRPTGDLGRATRRALVRARRPTPVLRGGARRRVEVLLDRQLLLAVRGNRVVRALPVSTGKTAAPTPAGRFRIYAKHPRWWSTPFREWLLWAAPFVGGTALQESPEVPVRPSSHGGVRVTQYDARWLYGFVAVGTPVAVLPRS